MVFRAKPHVPNDRANDKFWLWQLGDGFGQQADVAYWGVEHVGGSSFGLLLPDVVLNLISLQSQNASYAPSSCFVQDNIWRRSLQKRTPNMLLSGAWAPRDSFESRSGTDRHAIIPT